ncbi:MAG TPA: pyruvate:ferredoxin (flavodoxin) oxidoreductase [candidate division Zixibacteria bacterium]|nr:pyruvate:ferredoxin (flavodoxin) oxidoreductase [candidate division Zixibacteria bacterium]HPM37345.1 pyruvate:ferredoxin (flavodoxin) oxidoreductase [candidate division Zixibacteria bacterium]
MEKRVPKPQPHRRRMVTIDGNTAAAYVAHATNEVIAIYPITPSSNMGEIADEKSARGEKNIWGVIPEVIEMQSEGGASGAVHGALTTGALTTTFTASQGLLLMIPNMFKIAGELTPTVFHVSARAVASHALSIFGDHSDVMACRSTGFGLMASGSVQEVMDLALITQAASLGSRVPFVHFFDGFRTSHEVQKVEEITIDDMAAMLDHDLIVAHRRRALSPDNPTIKGTSQNPDVFFQHRETVNRYYLAAPALVQKAMDRFAGIVGRGYHLFDYMGHPEADRVVVVMGSGAEVVHETVDALAARGEKVGVIKVRLYRPFSVAHFVQALPKTVRRIAVLDRTKEPGSVGEPMYTDVQTAIREALDKGIAPFSQPPLVIGGRYGLGSKEFNPPMAKAVFDNLAAARPKDHFTVGIVDDVTHTSLEPDYSFDLEGEAFRGLFYGLGADGTVGANKNSIKILGENTDNYAQGYFVYDSKKSGAITVSHVRFGKNLIRKPYLIRSAQFVACHNFSFLEKYDMLTPLLPGGTFLLNAPYGPDEVWDRMPREVQQQLIDKKARFFVIDAISLAKELGLGARINMIMQTAFFAISDILPRDEAITAIKHAIVKTYGAKGEKVVKMNFAAVDGATDALREVKYPHKVTSTITRPPIVPAHAPEFVKNVTAEIIAGRGDDLPVSAFPDDGTYMTATTQYEKRNIAVDIPIWDREICTQCNICSIVCPHAAIRPKVYEKKDLAGAPAEFPFVEAKTKQLAGKYYTLQVAPEDCTGCEVCVNACPVEAKDAQGTKTGRKAINMTLQAPIRERERANWEFFINRLPENDPDLFRLDTVKGSQFARPLFEFSGACSGCGETPYLKLMTQLFGDRAICANATGCSSIYGGNLPTTPYCRRADGRGPAWSNSLFEDNAEFGLGMRLTADKLQDYALTLVRELVPDMYDALASADQSEQAGIAQQRERVAALLARLDSLGDSDKVATLRSIAYYLVKKSVWVIGGDGWAYDIGYGGLDHVLASGKNVNLLVLDTEVYSNTGGQMSKSTPRGSVAKFAAAGKPRGKKDLGMMMMSYGSVYVAQVALGASNGQTVKAMIEAERYNGPSLIIAYSACIAHGIDMAHSMDQEDKAVRCGHWMLYRYNPDLIEQGKNPLQLDSKPPSIPFSEYAYSEIRFRSLKAIDPERAAMLLKLGQQDCDRRWRLYSQLAGLDYSLPPRAGD